MKKISRLFKDELFSKSLMSLIIRVGGMGCTYIIYYFISQKYDAAALGRFNILQSLVIIFVLISSLGLDKSIVKFFNVYKSDLSALKSLITTSLILTCISSSLIGGLIYLLAPWISNSLSENPIMISYVRSAGLVIVLYSITNYVSGIQRAKKDIINYSLLNENLNRVLLLVLIALIVLFEYTEEFIPSVYLFSEALVFIYALFLIFRSRSYLELNSFKKFTSLNVIGTSLSMLFTSSFALLNRRVDVLILGYLISDSEVGIYSAATRIALVSSIFLSAVNGISGPKLSETYHSGDTVGFRKTIRNSVRLIMISSLPVTLILIAFPGWILGIFGSDFTQGVNCLIVLSLAQLFNAISGSVGLILQMIGHEKEYLIIVILSFIINLLLIFLLTPFYGITGAAIAGGLAIIFNNAFAVYYVKKYTGITTLSLIWKR